MSDELNKQEQGVQDILRGAKFEPNMDGLWEQVDAQLEKEQPRKKPFFWWSMGALVLCLGSLVASYFLGESTLDSDQLTEVVVEGESENQKAKSIQVSISKNQKDALPTGEDLDDRNKELPQVEKEENATKVARSRGRLQSVFSEGASPSEQFATSVIGSEVAIEKSNSLISTKESIVVNSKIQLPPEIAAEKGSDRDQQEVESLVSVDVERSKLLTVESLLDGIVLIPTKKRSDYFTQFIRPLRPSAGRYFVTLRGGVSTSFTTVSDVTMGADFDLEHFEREQGVLGLDVGLDIGRNFSKWRVLAGVGLHQSNTRYSRSDKEIDTSLGQGTAFVFIADDGSLTTADGEITISKSTDYDLQWHRRHQMVDLHFGVGRELFNIGIFSFGLDALVGLNVSTNHSGYQFAERAEALQKITVGQENIYRKNMGVSAAIAGHVSLQVQQVVISLVPVLRHQFSSLTNTDNFYQIKNSQLGLQLGITYKPRWK